jgi:hypothetical protein
LCESITNVQYKVAGWCQSFEKKYPIPIPIPSWFESVKKKKSNTSTRLI